MTSINEWAKKVHGVAVEKGWWDEERDFGDLIALAHCELSEAYESYRNNEPPYYLDGTKPEGYGVELVDAIIRLLDTCDALGIDIEQTLEAKHNYNKGRSYRHGGKKR